jgi:hypothetical protein
MRSYVGAGRAHLTWCKYQDEPWWPCITVETWEVSGCFLRMSLPPPARHPLTPHPAQVLNTFAEDVDDSQPVPPDHTLVFFLGECLYDVRTLQSV